MKILTLASCSFLFMFLIVTVVLFMIIKYSALAIKYKNLSKYLFNYLNIITSARYGNLNSKCPDGVDALTIQMSRNTNALLESIFDRDVMINEYIEKEKQSQNIKQDFISSLAHDLKVPIIAQDNTYDLFLNGNLGTLNEIQKDAIKNLKISNNDLKNLIVDLLDAQKLDSKELEPNPENTNLNSLITEIIEQNKSITQIKNKKVIFEQKEQIFYQCDSFLIKRAVSNLLYNAIAYSKDSENIYIKLSQTDKDIQISVIDNGDGIKEDEINQIFTKYYTSAKKYSNIGIGLGLYIANKIALSHKGKLVAQNNPTKGACFTLKLPL